MITAVQWSELHASNAGSMGLIPGHGTEKQKKKKLSSKNKKFFIAKVIISNIKITEKRELADFYAIAKGLIYLIYK